jgi:hypothetical protein
MAAESKLRKLLKARVEAYGGEVRALSWIGRRNAPDVLCLMPYAEGIRDRSYHIFVETKGTKKVSEAQTREHKAMRDAGCQVIVILTEAELDKWLPPL